MELRNNDNTLALPNATATTAAATITTTAVYTSYI